MNSLRSTLILPVAGLMLAGCHADAHSPTLDVLGSYFPAWVVCIVIGLALTLITRLILIGLKINAYLQPIVLVYLCLMIFYTLSTWLLFFQN
jgi:YtcA family